MKLITSWDDVPIIMDLPLAGLLLGKHCETLKVMSRNKMFPAFKVGKEWRVTKADLLKYIEKGKVQQ